MMNSGPPEVQAESGASERGLDALTHVLALESRNSLARVELAASQIDRIEATPAIHEMVETIHDAVSELDGLLGKIASLWSPAPARSAVESDLTRSCEGVVSTLRPVLAARGIEFIVGSLPKDARLGVASGVLRRTLLTALRLASLGLERGDRIRIGGEALASRARVEIVSWTSRPEHRADEVAHRRELALDLSVELAAWGGRIEVQPSTGMDRLLLDLPALGGHLGGE